MWVANLRSSMRGRQQQLAQPRKMAWQPRSSDFGTTFQDRNGDKGTVGHSSSQKVTTSRKMTGAANVSSAACLSLQFSAAKMTPPHYYEMPALLPTEALLLVPKLLLTQKSPAALSFSFSPASHHHGASKVPLPRRHYCYVPSFTVNNSSEPSIIEFLWWVLS